MVGKAKTKKDKASEGNNVVSDGYTEKLVSVNRVAKVVKGGRIFSFSVVVVVGGKGRIGVGTGKAREVPAAIKKAMERARLNMVKICLHGDTLQHPITSSDGATTVFMRPASAGTGIIAGGAMRAVFEVLGVQDVLAKCLSSTSKINIVRATIKGLVDMNNPEAVARKRGLPIEEIITDKQQSHPVEDIEEK